MTYLTSGTAATAMTEHVITACPEHGEKVTLDRPSFVTYVEFCLSERLMVALGVDLRAGLEDGASPWTCCDQMVIDPFGELD